MNQLSYIIVNNDTIIGHIYYDPIRGRTIVMEDKITLNSPIELYMAMEDGDTTKVEEKDLIDFIWEMLPR